MAENKIENDNTNYFRFAGFLWTSSIISGMVMLFFFAYVIPPILITPDDPVNLETMLRSINYYIIKGFGSQFVLQWIFKGAVAIHALESLFACFLSIEMGCKNTWHLWTLQTLILGFPSLRLNLGRREKTL